MRYILTDARITNVTTGEILDLTPLRHKPRGRVSRSKRVYRKRRYANRIERDIAYAVTLTALLVVLLACVR